MGMELGLVCETLWFEERRAEGNPRQPLQAEYYGGVLCGVLLFKGGAIPIFWATFEKSERESGSGEAVKCYL